MKTRDAVAEAKRWMEVCGDGSPYFTREEIEWRIRMAEEEHARARHVADLKFWGEMLGALIMMPAKDDSPPPAGRII